MRPCRTGSCRSAEAPGLSTGTSEAYVDPGTFKQHYDGGAAGSADLDYKVSGFTLSGLVILPMSGEFFFFGRLGAQYDFTRPFAARAEYENYGEVGDSKDTGRAKVCLAPASLLSWF